MPPRVRNSPGSAEKPDILKQQLLGYDALGVIKIMSEDEHPLLTKRAQGVVAILALATTLGIALMGFHLFISGLLVVLTGAAAAIWIYADDFRRLRLRLVAPDGGLEKPQREMMVLMALLTAAIIVPAVIFVHELNAETGGATKISARLRLHYTGNPITSEIMQNENVATKYTFAFLSDGTSITDMPNNTKIAWSDLIVVFDRPTAATNLRVRFDSGGSLVYQPVRIEPRLAIIRFEGSLADKVLDIEFN
jgi:hypothetical protein